MNDSLKRSAFGECRTVIPKIGGVETSCLWDTGSSVIITITESHFRKHFEAQEMISANRIELTADNGFDIPELGCLEAEVCWKTSWQEVHLRTNAHPHIEKSTGSKGLWG